VFSPRLQGWELSGWKTHKIPGGMAGTLAEKLGSHTMVSAHREKAEFAA